MQINNRWRQPEVLEVALFAIHIVLRAIEETLRSIVKNAGE